MVSKYDGYWRSRLGEIKNRIEEALQKCYSSEMDVSDIRRYGYRQIWSTHVSVPPGTRRITEELSYEAHGKSLGNVIIRSGILADIEETLVGRVSTRGNKLFLHFEIKKERKTAFSTGAHFRPLTERRDTTKVAGPRQTGRQRWKDIQQFYSILNELKRKLGGMRRLKNCTGRMNWPQRGVYFFFNPEEPRENGEPRVVRVGTHALEEGSRTTLWKRLRLHRGPLRGKYAGGGAHRASVFRKHVGLAIIRREGLHCPTWGKGFSAGEEIRRKEHPIEKKVSQYIRNLPFLWLEVDDEPGPSSMRAYLEQNSIALLSNFGKEEQIDPPTKDWLGYSHPHRKIRESGLWNVDYVDVPYASDFLEVLERYT